MLLENNTANSLFSSEEVLKKSLRYIFEEFLYFSSDTLHQILNSLLVNRSYHFIPRSLHVCNIPRYFATLVQFPIDFFDSVELVAAIRIEIYFNLIDPIVRIPLKHRSTVVAACRI